MSNAAKAVLSALEQVPVFDPHCHLRPEKPWADSLADIVLYHHVWLELVSAGMDLHAVTNAGLPHELADPGIPPRERVRRSLPYLTYVRNTTAGLCLRWLLQDLYGLDGELNESNLDAACRAVEERGRQGDWNEHVLRNRCRIEQSITVKEGPLHGTRMLRGREKIPIRIGGGKWAPHEVLARFGERFGRPIRSVDDYLEFLAATVRGMDAASLRYVGLSFRPWISAENGGAAGAETAIRKAAARKPLNRTEDGGFSYFAACRLLEELRATPLRTIQVLVGTEVLPPHRSIPCWSGHFTGALGRIAGEFEDFHFNVSSASDQYTQDLGVLAKQIPNVSVAGHWWHSLYPHYIRRAIETRIDMVPMNKIIAYFSDAYHSEWCYPKLKLVKAIWGEVLTERVAKGWCDVDTAVDLVNGAFWENPRRIYGGPHG